MKTRVFHPGKPYPLGSSPCRQGVNFSVFANKAEAIELLFFDTADDSSPQEVIRLDPLDHNTHNYWHVCVPGIQPGQIYAYRAIGPYLPEHGLRYDRHKVLLDPYARAIAVPGSFNREAAALRGDNCAQALKSVYVDTSQYDWEGDLPLKRPFSRTIIYEMHVRGFTRHPNSGVTPDQRGTFAGLVEKIPYLQDLGVTAVELLPVFQFDPQDAPHGLVNYWGYQPISFFAPHHAYSASGTPLGVIDEFRDMVKALHRAGIEVYLDVVFNHTAEAGAGGPTYSYRGLANDVYYLLDKDRARYANYTGTGNTLNANQAVVRRLIMDSLHYWVREMHVDGFRFDLASILSRDESGNPHPNPPVLWDIDTDPLLAGTKLIAEAWDAAGLYQVGSFVGDNWKEWNGKFRDDVRSFLRGDNGTVTPLAQRILGSPDLYGHEEREPEQSINFVTAHDGFTLNDLVSYNRKHNWANGEGNRDGMDENLSWNCGVEGPVDPQEYPEVAALRNRQVKNFFTLTLMSIGAPMIVMGDEVRRTQQGNNNAYCQDNEISWFDWSLLEKHADIYRFVKEFIKLRLSLHDPRGREITLNQLLQRAQVQFHGVKLYQPDDGYHSRSLAFSARSLRARMQLHAMLNAYDQPLAFELPVRSDGSAATWRLYINTAKESPHDIHGWEAGPLVENGSYLVAPYSIVVLAARIV
jgi:glycogen operon protein